jgi:hypothetical protein
LTNLVIAATRVWEAFDVTEGGFERFNGWRNRADDVIMMINEDVARIEVVLTKGVRIENFEDLPLLE